MRLTGRETSSFIARNSYRKNMNADLLDLRDKSSGVFAQALQFVIERRLAAQDLVIVLRKAVRFVANVLQQA